MKFLVISLGLFVAVNVWATVKNESEKFVTITGYGNGWGQEAFEDAQANAKAEAKAHCKSDVNLVSEWDLIKLNQKEGYLFASATATFECLEK